jgi:glutathione peroxidase
MTTVYAFHPTLPDHTVLPLDQYKGRVLLITNTASQCGFTPQYHGLEALYQEYKDQGLEVMAFPCNQFGKQEPGDDAQIHTFCERNFGVSFPLFSKIDVNGKQTDPLFVFLKKAAPGFLGTKAIKWNFTKFLVKKDGSVYKRYAPTTKPEAIRADIEKLLAE